MLPPIWEQPYTNCREQLKESNTFSFSAYEYTEGGWAARIRYALACSRQAILILQLCILINILIIIVNNDHIMVNNKTRRL